MMYSHVFGLPAKIKRPAEPLCKWGPAMPLDQGLDDHAMAIGHTGNKLGRGMAPEVPSKSDRVQKFGGGGHGEVEYRE